ncbi:MAG: lipase [Burkholderiales bacterium]|nr:lipase [Burkholderiales bacterium]
MTQKFAPSNPLSRLLGLFIAAIALLSPFAAHAACLDNVVLVHGNTGYPSHWDNTVAELKRRGYVDSQLYRPNWGSKICATCNDHGSANTTPVKNSMKTALAASCTGKIDVIGHSMGVTLAMKAINELGYAGKVNTYVGIAGGQHGLVSCGVYPFNVWNPGCGSLGLSINSPLVNSVRNKRYGAKMYSIKSYIDEVVCIGSCFVYGSHTSNVDMQNATYDFALGHLGLIFFTPTTQANLLMN